MNWKTAYRSIYYAGAPAGQAISFRRA